VEKKPLTNPQLAAAASPRSTASRIGTPESTMRTAISDPVSASTDPTERSISAEIRVIVIPAAMIDSVDASRKMFLMLFSVRKYGDANER
jgi:hypothetical protein